jgi:hypothetical protein
MLRALVNCFPIILLVMGTAPCSAADLTVAEQVAKLKDGRKITVKLNNGEILKGRMGSVTTDRFSLEPPNKSHGTARLIPFDEVHSVKPDGLKTWQKSVIVVGVIWVALAILGSRT